MPLCPQCSTEVPTGSRYCPGCGAMQSSVSQMATELAAPSGPAGPSRPATPPITGTIGRLESSASFAGAVFQPGQMLSGRYRVIGLLGRGGMGEVYRADDLEACQAVSLKFLAGSLGSQPELSLLLGE